MTKSEEIMELVDEYREIDIKMRESMTISRGCATFTCEESVMKESYEARAKLQAFADEYQELKYCYSPELRRHTSKDRRAK